MAEMLQEWLRHRFASAGVWDVVGELAKKTEADRVDLLRPHEEQKVPPDLRNDPASVQGIRRRLDDALELLTLGEIAAQMCELFAKRAVDGVPAEVLDHLKALTRSPAFRRYLEVYQFAGVRFLVARELELLRAAVAPVMDVVAAGHSAGSMMNWTSLPLFKAPSLKEPETVVVDLLTAIVVAPKKQTAERAALDFLEGFDIFNGVELSFAPTDLTDDHQVQQMELWLRGLLPEFGRVESNGQMRGNALSTGEDLERGKRFEKVAYGLLSWAKTRATIYWALREGGPSRLTLEEAMHALRPERGWNCDTPKAARLALADLYFLSKLLRAEVSPRGEVVYGPVSWLGLISMRAALEGQTALLAEVRLVEEVLRSVFGLVCELFHNGAELQAAADYRAAVGESVSLRANTEAWCWRAVFDAELEAISRQRKLRYYGKAEDGPKQQSRCKDWSWPLREEGAPRELIGLCFSGGGIRSATFNLGVLEGLQELDMLRQVDYLSTVSGGGFVGGWLVGNVRRSRYWLGSQAPWKDSIRHLRQYSNYLAPTTGLLSMDTWSLGGLWLRNTLLIQLLVLAWVLAAFAGLYLVRDAYGWMKCGAAANAGAVWSIQYWILLVVSLCSEVFVAGFIITNLRDAESNLWKWLRDRVRLSALLTWLSCALISIRILAEVKLWVTKYDGKVGCARGLFHHYFAMNEFTNYSRVLELGVKGWPLVLVFTAVGLFALSWISLRKSDNELQKATGNVPSRWSRVGLASLAATLCTVVLHLLLSAVAYVALRPGDVFHKSFRGELFGFVFGPAAVVGSYSLIVLLLVGLLAKRSNEPQREWWTRYGAWILVSALLGMVLSGVGLGAPKLVAMIAVSSGQKLTWTGIASWVATMVGGLFAGKSSKTSDQTKERSLPLEVLAQLGGMLFLVSFLVGSAWLLFAFFHAFRESMSISGTIATTSPWLSGGTCGVLLLLGLLFSSRFEINLFGLNQMYRNRLVRSYLGATRWVPGMRHPDPFTQFDFKDDLPLTDLRQGSNKYKNEFRGPFPVVNCSMNMGGSRDLSLHTRHSASFIFTPLHCGADRATIGYVDTKDYAGGDVGLGMAIAISGAAASPNMGYNTSPLVALLLSMFDVRLGWWIPNPGQLKWRRRYLSSSIRYMFLDLLGIANDNSYCLNISDGGHFENMGLYEMVRRRCKVIILGDGECDEIMQFGGLANAIRLCATDFGARIEIDLASLKLQKDGKSLQHAAVGTIQYANGSIGRLIYLKASLTGDEDATVAQYHAAHPTFPHQTTANQFFTEDQFESYRRLGRHVVRQAFRSSLPSEHPAVAAERMADTLSPQSCSIDNFVRQSKQLDELWERLRSLQDGSAGFLEELMGLQGGAPGALTPSVIAVGLEIFQFMENVHMELRLDDFWDHPDNRGWAMLFMNWARSTRLRQVWRGNHRTFGIRFEYFCGRRLGLYREKPVLRVTPLPRD